jgi:predicted CoA-binding protein
LGYGYFMKNKTLVLGASENPDRYSNKAILKLLSKGQEVVAIGKKAGNVNGVEIVTEQIPSEDIETVTLYLNPTHQIPYYDYILSLKPKRVIFNPGTENDELERIVAREGINVLESCTLVMLSTGQY